MYVGQQKFHLGIKMHHYLWLVFASCDLWVRARLAPSTEEYGVA